MKQINKQRKSYTAAISSLFFSFICLIDLEFALHSNTIPGVININLIYWFLYCFASIMFIITCSAVIFAKIKKINESQHILIKMSFIIMSFVIALCYLTRIRLDYSLQNTITDCGFAFFFIVNAFLATTSKI